MANEEPDYLAWVRWRPCLVCKAKPCEAHHPRHDVGMGLRAHDSRAVPLCSQHHRELHSMNGAFGAWSRDGVRAWLDKAGDDLRELYAVLRENDAV